MRGEAKGFGSPTRKAACSFPFRVQLVRHFEGPEAERWYALGMSILDDEMPEQVLSDGGYSELSPKYHAIVLEDLLDLLNAMQTFARKRPGQWADAIAAMRAWLATMLHARLRRRPHVFEGANPQVGRRLAAVTSVTVFCQTPDPSALHRAGGFVERLQRKARKKSPCSTPFGSMWRVDKVQ